MKTRVLLLAGFLVLGAGCGNKDANGEKQQANTPVIRPLPADQLDVGQRLSAREFLDSRPRLERVLTSSNPRLNGIDLKFRRLGYTMTVYSNGQPIDYQVGTVQRANGRLLLSANFGSVRPFKNAQGDTCAHLMLNATPNMPAVTITACEENFDADYDRNDRDDRRRPRY